MRRNKVATSYVNDKFYEGLTFNCNETGIYYFHVNFRDSKKYCGTVALGFAKGKFTPGKTASQKRRSQMVKKMVGVVVGSFGSSNGSSSPSSSSSSSNEKTEVSSTSECDGAEEGNISVPSYENGDWSDGTQKYSYFEFSDNVKGNLYHNTNESSRNGTYNKYYISGISTDYYYQSYNDAVRALYIYKKCGKITDRGRFRY